MTNCIDRDVTDGFGCTSHRITAEKLREICKKNNLYRTPHLNDVLYLHFKGCSKTWDTYLLYRMSWLKTVHQRFTKIENLEAYTGLKALWLENNCLSEICGLDNQKNLVSLYLHHNVIKKIENLEILQKLDTINLCHNFITSIENLSVLPVLSTLQLSHNKLSTASDIAELVECDQLTIVDLSYNYLDDPKIVEIFEKMKSLRVLNLTGNPGNSKITNYRKSLILACNQLCYLDDRPISERDRLCAEAWSSGGLEAEQALRTKLIDAEHKRVSDSVNALSKLRSSGRMSAIAAGVRSEHSRRTLHLGATDESTNLITVDAYFSDSESSSDDDGSALAPGTRPYVQEIVPVLEMDDEHPPLVLDGVTAEYVERSADVDREDGGMSTAEGPAVQHDEPAVHLDEPAVYLDEPTVNLDEPAVHLDEPAVHLDELVVHLDEPVVHLDEPAVILDELEVHLDEPAVGLDELAVHRSAEESPSTDVGYEEIAAVARLHVADSATVTASGSMQEDHGGHSSSVDLLAVVQSTGFGSGAHGSGSDGSTGAFEYGDCGERLRYDGSPLITPRHYHDKVSGDDPIGDGPEIDDSDEFSDCRSVASTDSFHSTENEAVAEPMPEPPKTKYSYNPCCII